MARLETFDPSIQAAYLKLDCPAFAETAWAGGPPLRERRVALISTAGLHRREDRPFTVGGAADFRLIPGDMPAKDLVMSHVSTNFDRVGFQQDWNIVFPIDRLRELATAGVIGSVAKAHYSFMGAADPRGMESSARRLASLLRNDGVDAVLLVPV
jgi:D-proline reductase (dithiol) PrdB